MTGTQSRYNYEKDTPPPQGVQAATEGWGPICQQRSAFVISNQFKNQKEFRHPCIPHKELVKIRCQCQLTLVFRHFLLRLCVPDYEILMFLEWLLTMKLQNKLSIILLMLVIVKIKVHPFIEFDRNFDHFVDKRKCSSVCFIIKDRCFNRVLISETSLTMLKQLCQTSVML